MTGSMPIRLQLLVVDDDAVDIETVRRQLHVAGLDADVIAAPTVSTGLQALESGNFDCALIDYRLPDGDGLELIRSALATLQPASPLILLTMVQDESVGMTAIHDGADDYLIKSQITAPVLARSIRYAIQRGRTRVAQATREAVEAHAREVDTLSRLASSEATPQTARAFGIVSLREGSPHRFQQFRDAYAEILDLALEQRAYRVQHSVSLRLAALADELGTLHAGPRDVIELHSTVLRCADFAGSGSRLRAVAEEGRLLVLELMGHLTQFYRTHSIRGDGLRRRDATTGGSDG
ncbi:MAG: response regulator [bacterium]